jgi:hypothetical protein
MHFSTKKENSFPIDHQAVVIPLNRFFQTIIEYWPLSRGICNILGKSKSCRVEQYEKEAGATIPTLASKQRSSHLAVEGSRSTNFRDIGPFTANIEQFNISSICILMTRKFDSCARSLLVESFLYYS